MTLVPMQLLAAANAVAQRCCATAPNVAIPVYPKHANCTIMFGKDVFEKFIIFCTLWRPFVLILDGRKSHADMQCFVARTKNGGEKAKIRQNKSSLLLTS